ncbi:MAG TPA: L-lactate permease, partial [Roseiarcus sp.]
MFDQVLNPFGSEFLVWLVALIPFALLLFLLAVLRMTAWLATLIGSIATLFLGVVVWGMPLHLGLTAYALGSLTG